MSRGVLNFKYGLFGKLKYQRRKAASRATYMVIITHVTDRVNNYTFIEGGKKVDALGSGQEVGVKGGFKTLPPYSKS